jgi:NAD(P)-dependent dehydrogenase (short-subunit alcohol dehydrogenase family)
LGAEAEFINTDVRKDEDIRNAVDKTVARFGRLDVAVNNAATEGQVGAVTDQTAESYAATFDTNVLGVLLSIKHEVRVMQKQGSGSIVNISSTYGQYPWLASASRRSKLTRSSSSPQTRLPLSPATSSMWMVA